MNRQLHGSCQVPIAGYATLADGALSLQGLVGDALTGRLVRASAKADASDPHALGREVAGQLMRQGAGELLGLA